MFNVYNASFLGFDLSISNNTVITNFFEKKLDLYLNMDARVSLPNFSGNYMYITRKI